MEKNISKMKIRLNVKSKALLVRNEINLLFQKKIEHINKENINFKKNILNNIKLKSKLKFSLNKEIKTQPEIKEENKENIENKKSFYIPSAPKIKKQLLRNNNLRKIPSTNYIHTFKLNKIKLTQTLNYSIKEENDKRDSFSNKDNTFQENNSNKIKSLKHIKKQFFATHMVLPKPFWLYSGTRIFDQKKNRSINNIKYHKNTYSEITSVNSIINCQNKGNNSNNNTTANTHKNSNIKNKSNSFKKYQINLKTFSRRNSFKKNNYIKLKKATICPVKHIINRNNSNICINKGESKNKINNNSSFSFMNKTQQYYDKNNNVNNTISDKTKKNSEEEYIEDILCNLLKEEEEMKIKIDPSYFNNQLEINEKMRAILIDWLIDVNNKFSFKEETLFIAINIIDLYLSLKRIKRRNLQLLGITALFIACKQNEIIFRHLKEYAYITDNAYNTEEILDMEKNILQTIDFNILFPSALSFYEILCNKFKINYKNKENNKDKLKFNFGLFLIQSFFMSSQSLKYYSSTISCSAMYIVMKFFKIKNYQACYNKALFNIKEKNIDNNDINIIKECAKEICLFVRELTKNNLKALVRNFSSDKYGNISNLVFGNLTLN